MNLDEFMVFVNELNKKTNLIQNNIKKGIIETL